MELTPHILGAFDTLAAEEVSETAFLAELRERGFSEADAAMALQKALMEGWLEQRGDGLLRKRTSASPVDLWADDGRMDAP